LTTELATPKMWSLTFSSFLSAMFPTSSELIDKLGGPAAVARMLGIKSPSVVAWRSGRIPDDKLIRLAPACERLGIATRKQLRPNDWEEIWPELATSSPGSGRRKEDQPLPLAVTHDQD
jgi:DNA-binding transcriptional regulator YdaS (Cro superfamily)